MSNSPSANTQSSNIAVIALGGTIAMTANQNGSVSPGLSGDELLQSIPDIGTVANVNSFSPYNVPSNHLTLQHLDSIVTQIHDHLYNGATGIVVTQGTDTIEETSFALDLLMQEKAPIIITGAMKNPTLLGADGPANLSNSVNVAASSRAGEHGVLLVFGEEIHAPRFVKKTHTSRLEAFQSEPGPLGYISAGRVRLGSPLPRLPHITLLSKPLPHKVAMITSVFDEDASIIDAVMAAGFDGIVVNALGGGHVCPAMADALGSAAESIPVILSTRTRNGEVLIDTYSYKGSEIDLINRGLIRAGWLDGLKSRVLLSLLLRSGGADEEIRSSFTHFGGG